VNKISLRGKESTWTLKYESIYEKLDDDISEAMKHSERMCNIRKAHATPWPKSMGHTKQSIRYWGAHIIRRGIRNNDDAVLNYYLLSSNVDKERFGTPMTMTACIHQLTNSRSQLKDVLKDAKSNGSFYEVEFTTVRVEKKYPHLTEDNSVYAIQREEKIEMEIKARENRRNTQGFFPKLGRQIRGHVKPNSTKKSSLTRVTVPDAGPEGLWKHIIGNDDLEDHMIEQHIEHFSHVGATPFGYTDLGKELGHTGDSQMAHSIFEGTLEHAALSDSAIHTIVEQLQKYPAIDNILKPVVTPEDFKSAFKCVPENTASPFSGR
jgi:hypothetical protein